MEYYSFIESNKVLIHVMIWKNFEDIKRSERNQTPKTTYCMIYVYEISEIGT